MTPRLLLADQLAHAALAAAPQAHAVRAQCAQVLNGEPVWLAGLVRVLLAAHARAWHAHSIDAVRESILRHRAFSSALAGAVPVRTQRLSLAPAVMAPSRIASAALRVPALPTPGDLAQWLGLDADELRWFSAMHRGLRAEPPPRAAHYRYWWVRKRSGGWRLLEIPKPRLRDLQRRILHGILDGVGVHEAVHGFRAGRSALTNAAQHTGQRVVIRMDLRDFFLGIGASRIRGVFKAMGYPLAAANVLTGLCTARVPRAVLSDGGAGDVPKRGTLSWQERQPFLVDHLPQGAPTSPALANLCAFALDVRLAALARALGATYTRYADDLVFSGADELRRAADRLQSLVGAIALEEGFRVNHRKTRVMHSARRQTVTGVVVNAGTNLARDDYDRLKAMLHNARGTLHDGSWHARVRGLIAHACHLNPRRGERLQRMYRDVAEVV